jgi:hypothetical protein
MFAIFMMIPPKDNIKERVYDNRTTKLTPVTQIDTSSQIPVFLSLGCQKQ